MKKILAIVAVLIMTVSVFAQSPEKMSYQAVVRDGSNALITSTTVGMQISILQTTATGTAVYVETQTATSNTNGLVTLEIGVGTAVLGTFATIDWSAGPFFIKTETDPTGGTNYTITGTSQLLSVPYSLHTKTAENFIGNISESQISDLGNYLTSEIDSSITNEIQDLQLDSVTDILTITNNPSATAIDLSYTRHIKVVTRTELDTLSPFVGYLVYNSTDDVTLMWNGLNWIQLSDNCFPQPTNAIAGPDQFITSSSTATTLSGNTPTEGTGTWTIISGSGGSFVNANDPTTTFTGTSCTNYTLVWEIATACSQTTDTLNISFNATPTNATAGNDQIFTSSSTSTILNANSPTTGIGTWTIISGSGGSFVNANDPTTSFTGTSCTNYTLVWEIATACYQTTDTVNISFNATPTNATAGSDQIFTSSSTSTILNANSPTTGIGTWTIISGSGGSFVNANDPTTSFTGTSCTSYSLVWEIATACYQTTDTVNISFLESPIIANAGSDIYSPSSTTVNLNGNNPTPSSGVWTVVSGTGGSFSNSNNYNSTFTGNNNETYILRWTTSNFCTSTYDDVKVYIGNVVGQYNYGGVIIYVDGSGNNGLVCDINDQSTSAQWGCYGTLIPGANGTAIGTGEQNMLDIVGNCSTTGIAADICYNYTNVYNDWFLPSNNELNEIYLNLLDINASIIINGGTPINGTYWSSSQNNSTFAYMLNFSNGSLGSARKNLTHKVRAIRAF